MRGLKIPQIVRNSFDKSITISYEKPKYSLIWMHGLGDEAESYVPFFTHITSPLYNGCRVKLIQAPNRWVTVNQAECNAWYDLRSLNRFTEPEDIVFDLNQVNNSRNIVENHFKDELSFWSEEDSARVISQQHRIYVGGMSQGGVMALHYGLSADQPPAGVLALSSYLLKSTALNNLRKMPILLMHGQRDPVIREIQARNSYSKLLQDQYLVEYKTIPKLDHGIALEQLEMMGTWLNESHEFIRKHYEKKEEQ